MLRLSHQLRNRYLKSQCERAFATSNGLPNMITGGQVVFNKLLDHNVSDVFLYSGGSIMSVIDAFYNDGSTKPKIKYYVNAHEQSLGHSATGYAKSTGKTGVSIVTSGPGLTNMVTPILDATNDSTPLVVFSGQVPLFAMGTNAFQECPATEITKSITKWNYCVKDPNELQDVIDYAFKVANDGKKGAVHVDLPKCVIAGTLDTRNQVSLPDIHKTYQFTETSKSKEIDINYIKKIAKIINYSKRPVLYVGQGAKHIPKLIRELVCRGSIPITTTIHGLGIVDENDDLSLKMVGMHGSPAANECIQESDCIISIGTRFDDRTTGNLEKYAPEAMKAAKEKRGGIIHCNINPNEIDNVVKPHFPINCDAELFVKTLLPYIEDPLKFTKIHEEQHNNLSTNKNGYRMYVEYKKAKWLENVQKKKKKYVFTYDKADNNKIKTQSVLVELNKQLYDKKLINNTFFSTGVGNHQMMTTNFINHVHPERMLTSGSLGVMGVGLPYAIGAQIAHPTSLVIDIDGDSSFNHTLSELKTIQEYNLPVKIFVCNDKRQSMVGVWEELFFEERYTATDCKHNPEYHKLAESYGIKGLHCDNYDDLPNTIHEALTTDGPVLVNFETISDKCYSLVPPGKALDEFVLYRDDVMLDPDELPPS